MALMNSTEKSIYRKRQQELAKHITSGLAVVFSEKLHKRSHDTEHPFRQNNYFSYLCGFTEDSACLVITTVPKVSSYLFVHPKDPLKELWSGKRIGPDDALKDYPIDESLSIEELEETLIDLAKSHSHIHCLMQDQKEDFLKTITPIFLKLQSIKKATFTRPGGMSDLASILGKMRLKKDKCEIALIKEACEISSSAHNLAITACASGDFQNEGQIQALMEAKFRLSGAQGPAYDSIVACGDNGNTLHYIQNNAPLLNDQMLLIDAGCELSLYASDITRTFPINGKFSSAQKEVYQVVHKAQQKAIEMARPGQTLKSIHLETCRNLTQGLIDLKVLTGDRDELFEQKAYQEFYPHGTSHWLGLDVHDPCPYSDTEGNDIVLEEGMVFTIEPGLYFGKNNQQVPEHLRSIAIRIEDDILITQNGHQNLTQNAAKTIDEIESMAKNDYRELFFEKNN